MSGPAALDRPLEVVRSGATAARVLAGSGVVQPYSPRTLARLALTLRRWGTGPAGGFATLAVRHPGAVGLVDERGSLTWADLHRRSNALARALADRGVGEGDSVALLARNHRGFLDATVAAAKLGAHLLYLNTAFARPQLVEVLDREQPDALVCDEEFLDLLDGTGLDPILAWSDGGTDLPTIDALIPAYAGDDLAPPRRPGRIVILTSGTTGTPKGAPRPNAGVDAAVALLSRMPLRAGWRTHVAAPLFHTWGYAHLLLAMLLGSTLVLRRRFDPAECLQTLAEERCDSLVAIPVMLQRMLDLPPEERDVDLARLRVVASSGSALPGDLALAWMDTFGDQLYNIYGSTEVSWASIATPEDLRVAPTSAGKPPWGTVVRVLDEGGRPVAEGGSGRIFVGNRLLFEGYSGGGGKEVVDGLMATGDVGRIGADGRLYVEGRDDEMIVSGGENVFPAEVEDCLARHPDVAEAAAVGVDDAEFGMRLRAFVVVAQNAALAPDDLKDWVRDNLARYKVPREIVFLPELPRNATGKVLKRELTEWKDGQ